MGWFINRFTAGALRSGDGYINPGMLIPPVSAPICSSINVAALFMASVIAAVIRS
jgi:hypothetical protein